MSGTLLYTVTIACMLICFLELQTMEIVVLCILFELFYAMLRKQSQSSPVPESQSVDHIKNLYNLRNLYSLLEYSQTNLESMNSSDLCFFLYCCGNKTGQNDLFEDPRYQAVVRSLYEKLEFNDITAQEVADACWGMAKCGIAKHERQYRDLLMKCIAFAISQVDAFDMRHLANLLWTFATIYKSKIGGVPSNQRLFQSYDEEVSIQLTELFTVVSTACQSKIMNDECCLQDLINIAWAFAIASNVTVNGCASLEPHKTLLNAVFIKCMNQQTYQNMQISTIIAIFARLKILSQQDKQILVDRMSQQSIKMPISSFKDSEFIRMLWAFNELDISTLEVNYLFRQAINQGMPLKFKLKSKFL